MPKISAKKVDGLIKKYNINTDAVSKETIIYAIGVELEHGKRYGAMTNIINDNIELSLRIALAHLSEFPNYYEYLRKMETKLDAFWTKKKKPSIYNRK